MTVSCFNLISYCLCFSLDAGAADTGVTVAAEAEAELMPVPHHVHTTNGQPHPVPGTLASGIVPHGLIPTGHLPSMQHQADEAPYEEESG